MSPVSPGVVAAATGNYQKPQMFPLEEITLNKFGQVGVEAIKKYPFLQGSRIASGLYLEEYKQPNEDRATRFIFKRFDATNVNDIHHMANTSDFMSGQVVKDGQIIWEKGGINKMLLLGGVLVVGIVAFYLIRKRK